MRIQHNIMAMNAYRNYNLNNKALSGNLEKLSSGYKINRAGDDAAGLAISEKMRAQITGLNAAQKNVKDGVSLVKTAEGAMQEIQDMLNRMDYLATQSANGTYDNEVDRANLQKEVNALKTEINRIAESANFNGIKLLNGELDSNAVLEASQTTGGVNNMFNLPDVGNDLGVNTILHKGSTESGKTEFSVNFGNQTFENQEGDKLTVTLGEGDNAVEMTLEGVADGKGMQAEDIAKALAEKYGEGGAEKLMLKDADGTEQEFKVTLGDNGYSLNFEQVNEPMSEGQVVEAPKSVKIEGTKGNVTPPPAPDADPGEKGVYSYQITTAFSAGDKLTIAGKDILFGINEDLANNTIGTTATNTKELQAAKIAELFKDDANWTVKLDYDATANPTGAKDKLIFEQKTPSTTNVMEAPTISSQTQPVGTLGAVTEKVAYSPATDTFDFSADNNKALVNGEQLTLGKMTVKFTNGTAGDGEIQVGGTNATLASDLDVLAKYINDHSDEAGYTAKVDGGNKLLLTATKGSAGGAAATSFAKKAGGTAPTVKANDDGTWTISLKEDAGNAGKIDFADKDKLTILGKDIAVTAAAGAGPLKAGMTLADAATAIATQMNTAAAAADVGSNLANLKFTANADGTITVAQAVPNDQGIGTISQSDIKTQGDVATAASAPSFSAGTTAATAASWTVDITTAFANGDKLVIDDGAGNTATIEFNNTATADGNISVTTSADAVAQATALADTAATQTTLATWATNAGYTITQGRDDAGNLTGQLVFTQTTAADPDAAGKNAANITFTIKQDPSNAAGTFNEVTAPKDPETPEAPDTPSSPTMTPSSDYLVDVSTIKQGAPANATRLASTVFELTDDIVKDGNILKIGDQTFTVKLNKDTEAVEGTEVLDLSGLAEDADVLREAAIKLSNATKNNSVFESSGYDGNKVSFLENKTKNVNADGTSKVDLSTFDKVKEQFMYGTAEQVTEAKKGSALTLQIGDTSEEFNQMQVDIGDMHVSAMGTFKKDENGKATTEIDKSIADIDISTQTGAQEAVDVIKNAINYVSSVRGDLGAIQNRLDHTANNLSVMAENIQDAESTIRDTDVAEEMMSYVKNNILVQSAQAMLAQANQVPQGVLQLLG